MTVTFVADGEVINGTAGTSVIVPRPVGTINGHELVAMIAEVGVGTITAPAGWTLLASVDAGSALRLSAYRKVAASEPASWTWTLSASVRNWGWVGAYSGVDLTLVDPVLEIQTASTTTPGTASPASFAFIHQAGCAIHASAGVRTASGTATTWTVTNGDTERTDLSTNGGSGTDLAALVSDKVNSTDETVDSGSTADASQSQSSMATVALSLIPAFIAYQGELLVPIIEVAFGADPDGDPSLWSWTDVSDLVHQPDGVHVTKGRGDSSSQAAPTNLVLTLQNRDGRFTPGNPLSTHYPNVTLNTPIRASVPYGYAPTTERALGFAASWRPTWDTGLALPLVQVVAAGRLQRLLQGDPARSPLYRSNTGRSAFLSTNPVPVAYWSCEEQSGAFGASSPIAGVAPAAASGLTFGADSSLVGSDPLPTMATGATLVATVPAYTATGQWVAIDVSNMPTAVTPLTTLLEVGCTGTATYWRALVEAAGVRLRAYDSSVTQILDASLAWPSYLPQAQFFGHWIYTELQVVQNGANVDYRLLLSREYGTPYGAIIISGTLNSRTIASARFLNRTATADLTGMSVGHQAVYTGADGPSDALFAMNGYDGQEDAAGRAARLCAEEGLSLSVVGTADYPELLMGPQRAGKVDGLLRECEVLNGGVIHDGGTGGVIVFQQRTARYNADVTMSLSLTAKELAPGFEPVLDDQFRANDVTASREGGGSARFEDTAAIARDRRYVHPGLTVNTHDDTVLRDLAAWAARTSSAPGMRYPTVAIDLLAAPALAERWLNMRIGSRAQVTSLMAGHPPGVVDVFAEGWTEHLGPRWAAELNCSPASPYTVFEAEDDVLGRLHLAGCTVNTTAMSNAGALSVAVAAGNALLPTSGSTPLTIAVAGAELTVSAISGSSSPQTLTTTLSNGIIKSLPAGSAVELASQHALAL